MLRVFSHAGAQRQMVALEGAAVGLCTLNQVDP
jgi:hypothetical protein